MNPSRAAALSRLIADVFEFKKPLATSVFETETLFKIVDVPALLETHVASSLCFLSLFCLLFTFVQKLETSTHNTEELDQKKFYLNATKPRYGKLLIPLMDSRFVGLYCPFSSKTF